MTEAEALRWVAELFEEAPGAISPGTLRTDIAAWDSLGVLTLIAALEDQFEIALSGSVIQGFETVGDILDIMRKNGKLH